MRGVYRVLAGLVALGVVVQASSMVYAVAGLGKYVDDGGTFDKAAGEAMIDGDISFAGAGGFALHGIDGMMVIPLLALLLLIVSFFAKVPGGVRMAAILFGLVALQIFLGIFSHSIPFVVVLHVLNAFAILGLSLQAGRSATVVREPAQPSVAA